MDLRFRRALSGAALVITLAACAGTGVPGDAPSGGSSPSPAASPSQTAASASQAAATDFDQAFIDMMVPHHQSATAMAKLAQEQAQQPELRTLAGEIIAAQDAEITQMRDWREEWFGSPDTPSMDAMPVLPGVEMEGMDMGMGDGATMDMTMAIDELRDAEPFDLAFIDAMTAHHESAIQAAEIALEESQNPDIRSLAEAIISSQQAEIDQMAAWRAEWYPGED